jgi:hypothetical protein
LAEKVLTERGVEKPNVGKSLKLSRLKHFSILGEENISMVSYLNLVSKVEYSTRNASKYSFLDTSAEDKGSILDKTTGVQRVESGN